LIIKIKQQLKIFFSSEEIHKKNAKSVNLKGSQAAILKNLLIGLKKNAGRSSQTGRITVRRKGGGCSRNCILLTDFKSEYYSIILGTFYDPNRSAYISLNFNIVEKNFFII